VPNRFGGLGKTGAKINEINAENEEWRAGEDEDENFEFSITK